MIKIVIDTNTLISALGWKESKPRMIFNQCILGEYRLVESLEMIKEFISVISRDKFSFITEEEKNEFLMELLSISKIVEPKKKVSIIKDDLDDNIILECAIEGKVDYIVSGDKHLKRLKEYEGIKIMTATELLDLGES